MWFGALFAREIEDEQVVNHDEANFSTAILVPGGFGKRGTEGSK